MKKVKGQDILLLIIFLILVVFVFYVFMNKESFMDKDKKKPPAEKKPPDYTDKTTCHGTKYNKYPCSFQDVTNYYDPQTCLIVVAPASTDGKGDNKNYFRCATRKDLDNISKMPKPKDRDMNTCYIVPGCGSGHGNSGAEDIKAFKSDNPVPQQCFSCTP